jgi:hypothetical protein
MYTYIAEWSEGKTLFSVYFEAPDMRVAENIVRRKGWSLIGEFIEEQDCPDDMVAQIEKMVTNPTMH